MQGVGGGCRCCGGGRGEDGGGRATAGCCGGGTRRGLGLGEGVVEESDAGSDGEAVAGEAVGEVAEEFKLEGGGELGVVHGQTDLFKGFTPRYLVYYRGRGRCEPPLLARYLKEKEEEEERSGSRSPSFRERSEKKTQGGLTRRLICRIGLAAGEGSVAREAPKAGGAHGQDDAQVAMAVGVEKDEDGGAAAGGELVPEGKGRGLVGSQAGEGGLGGGTEKAPR